MMSNEELLRLLQPYVKRRVRISSNASSIAWQANQWPMLTSVKAVNGDVWLHYDDGYSYEVSFDGLTVELEPCLGSYDFAAGADQLEAIATAIRRYGPSPIERRARCSCNSCSAAYGASDKAHEAAWLGVEEQRDKLPEVPPEVPDEPPAPTQPPPPDEPKPDGGPDLRDF